MVTISPVILALIGTVVALGSALVSGAVVWGTVREKVTRMECVIEEQTKTLRQLVVDIEVMKSHGPYRNSGVHQ